MTFAGKCIVIAIFLFPFSCSTNNSEDVKPVAVIFDTDMGPDYDDVGALAMLHAFADRGDARILATMASTKYENVAAVLSVLNTYFERPDIPIGVPKGDALTLRDFQHWSDSLVANYPHAINSNDEVPDATALYRRILSQQPDNSVTIITVGFLTNIASLLRSSPDQYSSMTGLELVDTKVKQLVSMAGKFPEGTEFNIEEDAAAAKYVFDNLKIPVLFSGFEIGQKIKSGLPLIHNDQIRDSPVKDVYRISMPMAEADSAGRMSWDQTAVLVGVMGYAPWYKVIKGRIVVEDDGSNRWVSEGTAHRYLVEDSDPSEVQELINQLMMHQPGNNFPNNNN